MIASSKWITTAVYYYTAWIMNCVGLFNFRYFLLMNTYGSLFSLYTLITFCLQREEFNLDDWGSILAPFHIGASVIFLLASTWFTVVNWRAALNGLSSFERDAKFMV